MVVFEMGPVGRPHLHQASATATHHVGYPERPTDLDQLASGDHHLSTLCQCVENQENGGRVIVHNESTLGPGQGTQYLFYMNIARPSLTLFDIIFQIGKTTGHLIHMLDCTGMKEGPAKIGVDHNACGIDEGF